MPDVVAEAVHQLSQDQPWASVRSALNNLGAAEMASYQVESSWLDAATADGLDESERRIAHRPAVFVQRSARQDDATECAVVLSVVLPCDALGVLRARQPT